MTRMRSTYLFYCDPVLLLHTAFRVRVKNCQDNRRPAFYKTLPALTYFLPLAHRNLALIVCNSINRRMRFMKMRSLVMGGVLLAMAFGGAIAVSQNLKRARFGGEFVSGRMLGFF